MKRLRGVAFVVGVLLLGEASAYAWHVEGRVYCRANGLPIGGVIVRVTEVGGPFTGSGTTDSTGFYSFSLPDVPGTFEATLDLSGVGGGTIVSPGQTVIFSTTDQDPIKTIDWVVDSPSCGELRCWLTGGGAKFSTITGTNLAEHGPQQNFGGNVNPSCDPDPGEGGQWNHLDHPAKLHFQGRAIDVVRCGNVDGIPPGSESPVTPFNFIEYQGTGTLKGIRGNRDDFGTVCFFARAEDRNEPGSTGQRDGSYKDRYFLRVFNCSTQQTLLFLDGNNDPSTVDPVTITDGNMQIHVSSCQAP